MYREEYSSSRIRDAFIFPKLVHFVFLDVCPETIKTRGWKMYYNTGIKSQTNYFVSTLKIEI
jgi:hypothetical protein